MKMSRRQLNLQIWRLEEKLWATDIFKRLVFFFGFFLQSRGVDIQKLGKGGQGLKEIEKEY